MEEINLIIKIMDIPTSDLDSSTLQNVLCMIQKVTKSLNSKNLKSPSHQELWINAAKLLWCHLEITLSQLDDQLLCATCFYNVLNIIIIKEMYFKNIIKAIDIILADISEDSNILFVLSLLYGAFQSSLLSHDCEYNILVKEMLCKSLDLLIVKSNEYTQYTFIIFKIIASYKKIYKTVYRDKIFDNFIKVKLLNLVCLNWESPIAGIRDLNKDIFQMVLYVCETMLHDILNEVNQFSWNKAKYFMLTEIILQETKPIVNVLDTNLDWIDGVINSIFKSGLVSAGADMYFAILKKFRSEEEWHSIFGFKILTVLNSGSFKAKENFINYWCINTLKVFPEVITKLFNGIITLDKDNLHTALSVIKQGNRLGLVNKNWEYKNDNLMNMLTIGTQHLDPYVRMASFDIICISQGMSLPTLQEYDLIYTFIDDNANSDCTILRINMLNSLRIFLNRLHVNFLHLMKQRQALYDDNLYEFCTKIQSLIENFLKIGGNYQRKLTMIKICSVFISSIGEIPRKRNEKKKENSKSLLQMLKKENMWYLSNQKFINILLSLLNDPAEDIKECIVQILHNYYYEDLIHLKLIDKILYNAQNSIKSKFFFEISSGCSMFKLVTTLLVKFKIGGLSFNSVEEIFTCVYKELITEHKSKADIITLIEKGKQLHAFISILHTILQVCLQNNYSVDKMLTDDDICELIKTLQELSIQFVEEDTEGSLDFSKINDMVNKIINESGSSGHLIDYSKISGLQQIVLNAMSLNVKTSCELSSTLIKCYNDDKYLEFCRNCLEIIANVLVTCRHKGAIESAGVSLGQSIQYLTSLPSKNMSTIPEDFLKQKLNVMINEANKLTSVTRRGAGLSIMVHRIVSSDMRKGKPLFHIFMKTILEACTKNDSNVTTEINDNALDLPKAIYIHLLTRVVTDSSLASDIMFYSSNLAEIAFTYLKDDKWQIRNAALQLYGALVPKLIGQKKSSTNDEESIATVACDEFRIHSPKLWNYIQRQINNQPDNDVVQSHSNLVPILNLLSSCAKRYNFSYDLKTQHDSDIILFNSFIRLLNSPIYTVRHLTSKCIFNMFQFELIYNTLLDKPTIKNNCLHGYLMLTKLCYKNYYNQGLYHEQFKMLKAFFKKCLSPRHSYLCKSLYDEMFLESNYNGINHIFEEVNLNKHAPGVYTWSNTVINKYVEFCALEQLPQFCHEIFKFSSIDTYCGFVQNRLLSEEMIPEVILKDIIIILFKNNRVFESNIILQILYEVSKIAMEVFDDAQISKLLYHLEVNNYTVSYKIRYIIPLAARLICYKYNVNANKFIQKNLSLDNIENSDVDMRYLLGLTNNEIGNIFGTLTDEMKLVSIEAAIVLLQDEDENVRNYSAQYVQNIRKDKQCFQPYVCLKILTDIDFLQIHINENTSIPKLCEDLELLIQSISKVSETKDSYNPFATDYKNIYFEADFLKENIAKIKNIILHNK